MDKPTSALVQENVIKRGRSEPIVSGNNFLAMYKYGMFSKSLLSPSKHHKSLATPVAVGLGILGTAGTGALGWWFWDDIKRIGKDAIQFFEKPRKPEWLVEKPEIRQVDSKATSEVMSGPVGQPVVNLAPNTSNQPVSTAAIAQSGRTESPPASVSNEVPFTQSPEVMSESHDNADVASEPIEPLRPYIGGEILGLPPGFSTGGAPAWGVVDKTRHAPIEQMIKHWSAPSQVECEPSEAAIEASQLSTRGSVAASIARLHSLEDLSPPRNSFHSTGSEFHQSKGLSGKDAEYICSRSDIQGNIEANGVPKGDWTHGIADPRPRRPGSDLQDFGSKRLGKVVSGVEKECLDQMFLGGIREEQKEVSVLESAISPPMSINKESASDLDGGRNQIENETGIKDTSIAVAPPATTAVLPLEDVLIRRHPRNQSNSLLHKRESLTRNLLHMCSKSNILVLMQVLVMGFPILLRD